MPAFIKRLALKNYKSIAECDVELRPLTVVVGRNGSGKSNLIDSLQFVADALEAGLEYAIRKRGGFKSVKYRGEGTRIRISITFTLMDSLVATFTAEINRQSVVHEELTIQDDDDDFVAARYRRRGRSIDGEWAGDSLGTLPVVLPDRLALTVMSGLDPFRAAFDALTAMRFYRLDPDAMREVQDPDEGKVLREDGSNLASVWGRLQRTDPDVPERLTRYLEVMVPELKKIHRVTLGPKETLRFHQASGARDVAFEATSMSDGTLRALGALVASRQNNGSQNATLVAIEEPETALHPGAVAALMDALHEASAETQIILTSHSPDVLDHVDLDSDALLVTESRDGATVVAGVDAASREAIRRHLYSPGELLRMDQLQPASSR